MPELPAKRIDRDQYAVAPAGTVDRCQSDGVDRHASWAGVCRGTVDPLELPTGLTMEPTDGTAGTGLKGEEAPHPQPARIFVALKIAADAAQELAGLSAALAGPSVRGVAPADIHLTLVPPWQESSIAEAIAKLARIAAKHAPFELAFRHVGYGPEPQRPHLLWADCIADNALADLRADLLTAFGQTEERPFRPHVTLARIRGNGARLARGHPFSRDLALVQWIGSVELMQSPPAGGRGYTVLASLPLTATAAAGTPQP